MLGKQCQENVTCKLLAVKDRVPRKGCHLIPTSRKGKSRPSVQAGLAARPLERGKGRGEEAGSHRLGAGPRAPGSELEGASSGWMRLQVHSGEQREPRAQGWLKERTRALQVSSFRRKDLGHWKVKERGQQVQSSQLHSATGGPP